MFGKNKKNKFFSANKIKNDSKKHILNDNILSFRFSEEIQKIQNRVEQKIVLDEEEYLSLIKEFKAHIKVLRGALRREGVSYPIAKSDSLMNMFLKDDEFENMEEIEQGKFKRKSFDSDNYDSDDYYEDGIEKKFAFKRGSTFGNKCRESIISFGRKFSLEEVEEEKIFDDEELLKNPKDLLNNYKEIFINYQNLKNSNGNDEEIIDNFANDKMDILSNEKILEEIKEEAVKKVNGIIDEKSEEIKNLKKKNEEIFNEMTTKEKDCAEKKAELYREISELKFKLKKSQNENNSVSEFIFTIQSDVVSLQEKIEKKSKVFFNFKKKKSVS